METNALQEYYREIGAQFSRVNGVETVAHYGDTAAEQVALNQRAGVLDLSFRGRLCLTGADRLRFLHGQVTNDVKKLQAGEGCYAALVSSKGRMESDLNVYSLDEELLLDFEPGMNEKVTSRLKRYIVSDDVEIVEVGSIYGLLSIQGPQAEGVVRKLGSIQDLPTQPFRISKIVDPVHGELYLANQPRLGTRGYDFYVPVEGMRALSEELIAAAKALQGNACGWEAFEIARIEAGIPRFGLDMDEKNLPQECGIESRAVSYTKGCYIGQEVLNRIHTMGHVNREFRGLLLSSDLKELPVKGERLLHAGKEVGWTTSAAHSPMLKATIALGYVHREANSIGTELVLRTRQGESGARVVSLPFSSG